MWNSKPKKSGCNCRARSHGNPKLGNGPCYGYGRRPAAVQRAAGKRLARCWLTAARAHQTDDVDE